LTNRLATTVAFFIALLVSSFAQAGAKDDVNFAYQQNPSSAQLNGVQRNTSIGDGTFWYDLFGTVPKYANLAVTPSSGLFVQVTPGVTNTEGAVYVTMPDDTSVFGTGPVALSADPTLITRQGLLTGSSPISVPVPAPGVSGTSIAYLIECTVSRSDANPVQYNFINNANQVTQGTVYHDRQDTVGCQGKASLAAAAPVLPAADTNYVGVASVVVPNGATGTTSGMITLQVANQIGSLLQAYGSASINSSGCYITGPSALCPNGATIGGNLLSNNGILEAPSGVNVSLCPGLNCTLTQTVNGTAVQGIINATGAITSNAGVSGTTGTFNSVASLTLGTAAGNGTINVPGTGALYFNYFSGAGGFQFCNGIQQCNTNISGSGVLTAQTGAFLNNVLVAGTTSGSQLGLNTGFSTTIPEIANSSDGGMNLSIAGNSGLGYRFFKQGSVLAYLAGLDQSGNWTVIGNLSGANGTFSGPVAVGSGGTVISPDGEIIAGNIQSNTSGVFTAGTGLPLSLCSNLNCNSTRLEVDTSGNVIASGLVTANAGGFSTSIANMCAGTSCVTPQGMNSNGNINTTSGGLSSNATNGSASNTPLVFFPGAGSVAKMNLQPNGNLGVTGTVTANGTVLTSSRTMKRDIYDLHDDPLDVVRTIIPRAYNYKTEPAGTPRHVGVIAEDTSILLAPNHKVYDVGATAMYAGAAAAEADDHVKALAKRVTLLCGGSVSDSGLPDRVDRLEKLVAVLMLAVFMLTVAVIYLLYRVHGDKK
jgi:hypothetical protein